MFSEFFRQKFCLNRGSNQKFLPFSGTDTKTKKHKKVNITLCMLC